MHSVSNAYVYGSLSIRGIEYELCLTKAFPRGRFCACRQPRFRLPSLHRSVACVFTSHLLCLFQSFGRMGVKNRAAWECRTNYYSQILFLCQAKCLLFSVIHTGCIYIRCRKQSIHLREKNIVSPTEKSKSAQHFSSS